MHSLVQRCKYAGSAFVCMYASENVFMHAYLCVHVYTTCAHACMHACRFAHIFYTHVCMYACVCMHVCMPVWM